MNLVSASDRNSFRANPKSVSEPIRKMFSVSFVEKQLKISKSQFELIRMNPNQSEHGLI